MLSIELTQVTGLRDLRAVCSFIRHGAVNSFSGHAWDHICHSGQIRGMRQDGGTSTPAPVAQPCATLVEAAVGGASLTTINGVVKHEWVVFLDLLMCSFD